MEIFVIILGAFLVILGAVASIVTLLVAAPLLKGWVERLSNRRGPPRPTSTHAPQLRFARTTDEVNVAYWEFGTGAPLVVMPTAPFSDMQAEWTVPEWRQWYEELAEDRRVVRYDGRGSGASDRDVSDYSLEAMLKDVDAVVRSLDLDSFALMGQQASGPAAIAYAVQHPTEVSELILWCTYANPLKLMQEPELKTILAAEDEDWATFVDTHVRLMGRAEEAGVAERMSEMFVHATTQENYRAYTRARSSHNVSALLADVKAPTLVLHRSRYPFVNVSYARDLAAAIPEAELRVFDGESVAVFLGNSGEVSAAIRDFLEEGERSR